MNNLQYSHYQFDKNMPIDTSRSEFVKSHYTTCKVYTSLSVSDNKIRDIINDTVGSFRPVYFEILNDAAYLELEKYYWRLVNVNPKNYAMFFRKELINFPQILMKADFFNRRCIEDIINDIMFQTDIFLENEDSQYKEILFILKCHNINEIAYLQSLKKKREDFAYGFQYGIYFFDKMVLLHVIGDRIFPSHKTFVFNSSPRKMSFEISESVLGYMIDSILLAPILEELIFRAGGCTLIQKVQATLENVFPFLKDSILTSKMMRVWIISMLFGYAHYSNGGHGKALAIGIGSIFTQTKLYEEKSIAASIGCHLSHNILSVFYKLNPLFTWSALFFYHAIKDDKGE